MLDIIELAGRIELPTHGLQNRCSTTELLQLGDTSLHSSHEQQARVTHIRFMSSSLFRLNTEVFNQGETTAWDIFLLTRELRSKCQSQHVSMLYFTDNDQSVTLNMFHSHELSHML